MPRFLIYANLYIAICAAVCIQGTLHVFGFSAPNWSFLVFAASSVIIIYNLYFFYSPGDPRAGRKPWFARNKGAVTILTGLAIVAFCITALQLNRAQLVICAIIGLLAFLYSFPWLPGRRSLNRLGILKIITLSLCWTVFTTWLPLAGLPVDAPFFTLVLVERWLFFFVLCLLLDIRDHGSDAANAVHTLPVLLGPANSYRLAFVLTALRIPLNLVHALTGHPLPVFNAFLLTTLLTGWMVWLCRQRPGPFTWLAGIDGMLLVNGVLLLVT